jgi:hypothetical protein
MALDTYANLKTAIADFLNRDDLTNSIDDFIDLAEAHMNREIRHWDMEKRATAVLNTQYTALPNDFVEPIRFMITDGNTSTVEGVSSYEIARLRMTNNNATGRPQNYAVIDGSIEVWPSPDTSYTLEMAYYEKIDSLNNSTTSNWILTRFPDAYLYGSLIHSAPYLADDQRIQTWSALYLKAMSDINSENERSKLGGTGQRIKIRSY